MQAPRHHTGLHAHSSSSSSSVPMPVCELKQCQAHPREAPAVGLHIGWVAQLATGAAAYHHLLNEVAQV